MQKNVINKVTKIIIIIVMLTLAIIGILHLIANYINITTESKIIGTAIDNNKTISRLDDGSDHPKGDFVAPDNITAENGTGHVPPAFFGTQSYCIEPGTGTNFHYERQMSDGTTFGISQYEALISQKKFHTDCIVENGHATKQIPFDSEPGKWASTRSTPVSYRYVGTVQLSPALAYVVSSNADDTTDAEILDKQHAIWNLRGTGYDNGVVGTGTPLDDPDDPTDGDQPSKYDDEAKKYADYYNSVDSLGGFGSGGGIVLQDNSGTEVGAKVNRDKEEYIIGPFNVSYIDVSPFSGVSNMYCVGYNVDGSEIKSRITIERIITQDKVTGTYSGDGTKPEFFDAESDDEKIDRNDRNYPRTNQGFYVVIKDPNKGVEDDSLQRVVYIALKMQFQWMETRYSADLYEGVHYEIKFTHSCGVAPKHTDTIDSGSYTSSSANCSDPNCVVTPIKEKNDEGEEVITGYRHSWRSTKEDTGCDVLISGEEKHDQSIMLPKVERIVHTYEVEIGRSIPLKMSLGGTVWEDGVVEVGKEQIYDGLMQIMETSNDMLLPNIKVTLYTADGNVAKLLKGTNAINPINTDNSGAYIYNGLNPMKEYYVTFEYNGQVYIPTNYMQNGEANWSDNSKATEDTTERNNYDLKFSEIKSYPGNYETSNSLQYSLIYDNASQKYYNATFTRLELMGYTLSPTGKYIYDSRKQLLDGYLYDENAAVSKTYSSNGLISKKTNELTNGRYPTKQEVYNAIIAEYTRNYPGTENEIKMKLQFIEDCNINAYTKSQQDAKGQYSFYPRESQFVLEEDGTAVALEGIVYNMIYPEQYHINLGLWRRQEANVQLKKKLYKVAVTINGQTQAYSYDDGTDNEDYWEIGVRVSDYRNYYSSLHQRPLYEADANTNTGVSTNNNTISQDRQIEVYATYMISVKNIGETNARIDEIVDYYDSDYVFMPDMSWLMQGRGRAVGIVQTDKKDEYVSIIDGKNISAAGDSKFISINDGTRTCSSTTQYIQSSQFTLTDGAERYENLYINLKQDNHRLTSGETEYLYLTFKVDREGGKLLLDEKEGNGAKHNMAEINGYSTYYADSTTLPNYGDKSGQIAGTIDVNSTPGNFDNADFSRASNGEFQIYEHNFEDDTDRAKGVKIYTDELIRKITGTVWEDKRTYSPDSTNALIGNGLREPDEAKIGGITVELYEVTYEKDEYGNIAKDFEGNVISQLKPALIYTGSQFDATKAITTTNDNGEYTFEGFIPGDYIVRFTYNGVTYNGQDYKSTSYQRDLSSGNYILQQDETTGQALQTDTSTNEIKAPHYYGYTNPEDEKQNETFGYGYDIGRADSFGLNVSDAKDIGNIRDNLNSKYTDKVSNALAVTQTQGSQNEMQAETGVIRAEVEYNRENSQGNNNQNTGAEENNSINGSYHIANLDLGLEERPKAGLELNKKVNNVKITLADKTVLFDATQTVDDLIWQPKEEYEINKMKQDENGYDGGPATENPYNKERVYSDYTGNNHLGFRQAVINKIKSKNKGIIQATMDEEIMHGSTIEITYDFKVTNIGEEDYKDKTFYYTGSVNDKKNIVTTKADVVLDYVANNLQFKAESNNVDWRWTQITGETAKTYLADNLVNYDPNDPDGTDNTNTVISNYNTILTTTALDATLVPIGSEDNTGGTRGNSFTETQLLLKQTMSPQNTADEFVYGNIAEIVSISNTVGRRMAFSVQGNQSPMSDKIQEPDTSRAEDIAILPPFGENYLYIGLAILIITILAVSIVVIKRTVLI